MSEPATVSAEPRAAAQGADGGADPLWEQEVWQLLGRADVIVRGVLEARSRAERRLWEESARAWLQDVDQAWVDSQRRSW